MLKIWQPLAIGLTLLGILSCSAQQHQMAQTGNWDPGSLHGLAETCGESQTTMTLPNGNLLYVFGTGEDHRLATPVHSIPGHEMAMFSEDGKPAKIIKTHDRNISPQREDTQTRIIWIETDKQGKILLAGCAGCTTEEDRVLAKVGEKETDRELLTGLLEQGR